MARHGEVYNRILPEEGSNPVTRGKYIHVLHLVETSLVGYELEIVLEHRNLFFLVFRNSLTLVR